MRLHTQASLEYHSSIQKTWDLATDTTRFPEFFKGFAIIPAIVRIEPLDDEPKKAGSQRKIYNEDGSVILEQTDIFEHHKEHSYRLLEGFAPPFSWLVRSGGGTWSFAETEKGTLVVWRYHFELTTPLVSWIVGPVLWIFFQRAMQNCLNRMKLELTAQ